MPIHLLLSPRPSHKAWPFTILPHQKCQVLSGVGGGLATHLHTGPHGLRTLGTAACLCLLGGLCRATSHASPGHVAGTLGRGSSLPQPPSFPPAPAPLPCLACPQHAERWGTAQTFEQLVPLHKHLIVHLGELASGQLTRKAPCGKGRGLGSNSSIHMGAPCPLQAQVPWGGWQHRRAAGLWEWGV